MDEEVAPEPSLGGEPAAGWVLGMLLLAGLGAYGLSHYTTPSYTPDSWSFYELSRSVFTDFYRVNTWRQYQFESGYGASFPPLWPVLIAVFDAVSGLGWRSGYALGFGVAAATVGLLSRITWRHTGSAALGGLVAATLLLDPGYQSELLAGRAIPLGALLSFGLFGLLWRAEPWPSWWPLATGVLAGLVTLTRFDFLLAGAAAALCVAWTGSDRRGQLRRGALHLAAYGLTLSPWMAWSQWRHGKLLASDNARTALAAVDTYVTDFYVVPPPTLFEAPGAWLSRYLSGAATVSGGMLAALVIAGVPLLVVGSLLVLQAPSERFRSGPWRGWWLPLPILAVQFLSVTTTGYPDRRYHTVLAATVVLVGMVALGRTARAVAPRWALALLLLVVPATAALHQVPALASKGPSAAYGPARPKHQRIAACLPENARVLVLDGVRPYPFGALTGVQTFARPRNLARRNIAPFVTHYGITHVVGKKKGNLALAEAAGPLRRACQSEPVFAYLKDRQ